MSEFKKIERKKGKINEIIYDNTVYHNGRYRFYLPVPDLIYVLKLVINSNETTEYIRITPFYINEKLNRQIEFEEMMFFIECRDNVTEEKREKFIQEECFYPEIDKEINEDFRKRMCLCDYKDIEGFQNYIKTYCDHLLDYLVPKMTDTILKKWNIKSEELLFGYICFEVHSE